MEIIVRAYRETDLASVVTVINKSSDHDGTAFYRTEEQFKKRLEMGSLDNPLDVFVAESPEGEILGYAEGFLRGIDEKVYVTRASILPQYRRMGLGRRLMDQLWQQAQSIAAQHSRQPVTLGSRVLISETDARQLLKSFGLQAVRNFYEMERDLSQPIAEPQPPPGIELRAWDDEQLDYQVWEVAEEAFMDHWRHIPTSFEEFQRRMRTQGYDRSLSFIALDGGRVVGGSLNHMGPEIAASRGENQGQIGVVFVSRPWRKQGLGSALVLTSLHEGRRAGHDSMELNVDAENLTGAVRLYEALGFTVARQTVVYERSMPQPAS